MRPIFELESVSHARIHEAVGTPGHTSEEPAPESVGRQEAEFFRVGDEGVYQGGPADPSFEPELEEPEPPRPVVVRTAEQDARRARFARLVAACVGAMAALLAVGVARSSVATASSRSDAPVKAVAHAAAPAKVVAPAKVAAPAEVVAVRRPRVVAPPAEAVEPPTAPPPVSTGSVPTASFAIVR